MFSSHFDELFLNISQTSNDSYQLTRNWFPNPLAANFTRKSEFSFKLSCSFKNLFKSQKSSKHLRTEFLREIFNERIERHVQGSLPARCLCVSHRLLHWWLKVVVPVVITDDFVGNVFGLSRQQFLDANQAGQEQRKLADKKCFSWIAKKMKLVDILDNIFCLPQYVHCRSELLQSCSILFKVVKFCKSVK